MEHYIVLHVSGVSPVAGDISDNEDKYTPVNEGNQADNEERPLPFYKYFHIAWVCLWLHNKQTANISSKWGMGTDVTYINLQ